MNKLNKSIKRVNDILTSLPEISNNHARNSNIYTLLNNILIEDIDTIYNNNEKFHFGYFGDIYMPYVSFGAINTKDLFGLDELIIFSHYNKMRTKYETALDLGANIGLHSILMAKCFNKVISFEPDEFHSKIFKKNIKKNKLSNVKLVKKAISSVEDKLEFTRLKGNTTGSHISGSKDNVYGEIEKFYVKCTTLENIINKYKPNFIKMDIEGQEKDVLLSTDIKVLKNIDMMIEISNEESAEKVFHYFRDSDINLFSQKTNWGKVINKKDMPFSYKEGSLFLSSKNTMEW